jgi:hypothetical protein
MMTDEEANLFAVSINEYKIKIRAHNRAIVANKSKGKHLRVVLVVLQAELLVVLHVVLLLGQKHRKVVLFLGQFCGQTPVAEQVVALEHLRVVLSVHKT